MIESNDLSWESVESEMTHENSVILKVTEHLENPYQWEERIKELWRLSKDKVHNIKYALIVVKDQIVDHRKVTKWYRASERPLSITRHDIDMGKTEKRWGFLSLRVDNSPFMNKKIPGLGKPGQGQNPVRYPEKSLFDGLRNSCYPIPAGSISPSMC